MAMSPARQAPPFYVETRPNEPQERLRDARILAGRDQQINGFHRSLKILDSRGEVVDLKRF